MMLEITEEEKREIFKLMATPGVEIEEIAEKFHIEYEDLMSYLADEYYKHNLDHGRSLCCR